MKKTMYVRYNEALLELSQSLSDSIYRPVDAAAFCQKHNISAKFLDAVRHLGGVQADTGRSTPATHYLIKLEELKDLTPADVERQIALDQSVAKPVPSAHLTDDQLQHVEPASAPPADLNTQNVVDEDQFEQAIQKVRGGLEEWATEPDADRPIDAFASFPPSSVQGQILEVLKPTLPVGTRCTSVRAMYSQFGLVSSEFISVRQEIDEEGDQKLVIETGKWTFTGLDDMMAILNDFQDRAVRTDARLVTAPAITE